MNLISRMNNTMFAILLLLTIPISMDLAMGIELMLK